MSPEWRRAEEAGVLGSCPDVWLQELDCRGSSSCLLPSPPCEGQCSGGRGEGGGPAGVQTQRTWWWFGFLSSRALPGKGCFVDTTLDSRVSPEQENVWEFWSCSESLFFFLSGNLRKFWSICNTLTLSALYKVKSLCQFRNVKMLYV